MTNVHSVNGLDVGQNLKWQRYFWRLQRVGWALLALVLVAAVLGLLGGPGLLNDVQKQTNVGTLAYRRYIRRDAGTNLSFTLPASGMTEATLLVDAHYLQQFQMQFISPQPDSTSLNGSYVVYHFPVHDSKSIAVTLGLWPNNTLVGPIHGSIGPSQNQLLNFSQWVLP